MNRIPKPNKPEIELPQDYIDAIKECSRLAREWIALHPTANPKVQFNYPKTVMLAAVMPDAIEKHFVSVNEEGASMLDHMGANRDDRKQPSVFMLRVALEMMEEIKNEESKAAGRK